MGHFWHPRELPCTFSLFFSPFFSPIKINTVLTSISAKSSAWFHALYTYVKPHSLSPTALHMHSCCEKCHQTSSGAVTTLCSHLPTFPLYAQATLFTYSVNGHMRYFHLGTLNKQYGCERYCTHFLVHNTFLLGIAFTFYDHCNKLPQSSHLK